MDKIEADVFCLTGQDRKLLAPATQATVLAKYSRSPESARTIVGKLTDEEANKFQEKWVVNYGHNSVAELASIPVCFEGISIVASKFIESWQRPGYSEKSTRYQKFSSDSFVTPPGSSATMKLFADKFYRAYEELMDPMIRICAVKMGKDPDDPKSLSDRTVKARAFDNLRYLLPAGTGTNVAVNAYVRDFRDMIVGLSSHSNPEFNSIGKKLHAAVSEMTPTLVNHTDPDGSRLSINSIGKTPDCFDVKFPDHYVRLRPDSSDPVIIENEFKLLVDSFHGMSWETFSRYMELRTQWQEVPEVFKNVSITYEMMMDYGAFRDLQRHRRCTQFVEPLTINYGYLVPDDIKGSPLESTYRETMEAINNYDDESVIHNVNLMQYMIPLGYLHRSMFMMDLKEAYYVTELRTRPQGHISYRRIAYQMFLEASKRYPELMKWCRAIKPDTIEVHN